ncbi:MAG: hypothetical protein KIT10_04380 [Flavobacteriales bacterium]|nr:hypothetical protein [Flavobacteriales bacterium]
MSTRPARSAFFPVAHAILLLIVLLGFMPSFLLRSLFPQPAVLDMPVLPGLFVVHGIILLLWYVLLLVQPMLIRSGRADLHRRLGLAGAALAVAVMVSTVLMVLRFPTRMVALSAERGVPVEELEPGLNMILWLDLFMLLLFVGFFAAAMAQRNKPQAHKRYMFFAGVALVFAATGRIGGQVSAALGMDVGIPLGLLIMLGLTTSLLVHDRTSLGRVTRTSWVCFGTYWVATLLSMAAGMADEGEAFTALLVAW